MGSVAHLPSDSAQRFVHPDSVACIEGYPRSANSFATTAFRLANPNGRLAHHVHVAGQIAQGVRLGVPTVLLLRRPADAAASLMVWTGGTLGARTALLYYVIFHRTVRQYLGRVPVCLFEEVVADPSVVVRRLNAWFGSTFREPPNDRAAIAEELSRRAATKGGATRAMPDAARRYQTQGARVEVAANPLLTRADEIYREIMAAAPSAGA